MPQQITLKSLEKETSIEEFVFSEKTFTVFAELM